MMSPALALYDLVEYVSSSATATPRVTLTCWDSMTSSPSSSPMSNRLNTFRLLKVRLSDRTGITAQDTDSRMVSPSTVKLLVAVGTRMFMPSPADLPAAPLPSSVPRPYSLMFEEPKAVRMNQGRLMA